MKIQILPVKNGKQAIYKGITLAGIFMVDEPSPSGVTYDLPVGVFELVPTRIITRPDEE